MNESNMMVVDQKIDQLNSDNITTVVKKQRGGKVKNVITEIPDREKSLEMINKFTDAVQETGFNARFVDVVKLNILSSPEHFLRVLVGNYHYYLSEMGLDSFVKMLRDHWSSEQIREILKKYGIRTTTHSKASLQHIVISKLSPLSADYKDQYYKFLEMTEKQLHEHCLNDIGVKKCGKMSVKKKRKKKVS